MAEPSSSSDRSRWRTCREVDETADPGSMSGHLDDIASVPGVADQKQRSLALLAIGEGDSVVDVGCGNGTDLEALAEIVGPRGRVVGVDRSRALIDDARARGRESGPIELVAADAEALPFADATFAAARADRTLQHLPQPDLGLAEMARVVGPGGRIVVTESQWGLEAPDLDPEVTGLVLGVQSTDAERRHWLGYLLPMMFQMAGLTEVGVESGEYRLGDPADLARLMNLDWCVGEVVRLGLVSQDGVDAWTHGLRRQMRTGAASVLLTIVHVSGTKS